MKVFISWSGERSRYVASGLCRIIRQAIQATEPWISVSMEKGLRWSTEIAAQLEDSKVGIICLTAENLEAPWILFEAGAISKAKGARVWTLLLGVKHEDVKQPLGQFQHTRTEQDDIRQLFSSINSAVAGNRLEESELVEVFERYWPEIERLFKEAESIEIKPPKEEHRKEGEILGELVSLIRDQGRQIAELMIRSKGPPLPRTYPQVVAPAASLPAYLSALGVEPVLPYDPSVMPVPPPPPSSKNLPTLDEMLGREARPGIDLS